LAARKPLRKTKKAARLRPPKAGPGLLRRLVRRIPPRPVVHAAIVLLLAAFAALGLAYVRRYVGALDQYRLQQLRLELPAWCPADVEAHLRALPSGFAGASVFDLDVIRATRMVYRLDPWVRKVIAVRTEFPHTLVVELALRRPAYAVERRNGFVLVDREGYVLPAKYEEWSTADYPLRFVWGVRTIPPRPGRRWSDPALLGGIETLEAIAARPSITSRLTITGADVSNYGGARDRTESDIDIITAGGCRILWGRPPSTATFGEVPVEVKLQHLEKLLAQTPRPRGMKINVRFADAGGGIIMTDEDGACR